MKLHFHPERSPGSSNVDRRVIYSCWVLLYTKEFKYAELSTSLHVWGACQFTQGFCRCQPAPSPQWKRKILLYLSQVLGNNPEYQELHPCLTQQGATHLKKHILIESYGAAIAGNEQSVQKSVLPMCMSQVLSIIIFSKINTFQPGNLTPFWTKSSGQVKTSRLWSKSCFYL